MKRNEIRNEAVRQKLKVQSVVRNIGKERNDNKRKPKLWTSLIMQLYIKFYPQLNIPKIKAKI